MANRIFSFLFLVCFLSCSQIETTTTNSKENNLTLPNRPNILWLVAEDLSPVIPSFGDSTIQTPTLSRLAAEGVCFDNFYSPSGVCAPSRSAIATGMYPTRIGTNHMRTGPWYIGKLSDEQLKTAAAWWPKSIPMHEAVPPPSVKMMSEYLRAEGYYCSNNSKEDYQFIKSITAWDESNNEAHWRNRKKGQPFFSIFNFNVCHESQIWGKTNDSLWVDENLEVPVPPYLPDTEIGRKDVRRMYSNVKEMDFQVGEILSQLEEDGLLDSTIIFWYTDHGGPLPRQKRLLYDSGIKVPMIVRFPRAQKAKERRDEMLSFIDLAPTVLSLAGIKPGDHFDGKAFLGEHTFKGERKYIHAAGDRFDALYDTNRATRDKRYKYIRYFQPEKPMLLPVKYRESMAIMQELNSLNEKGKLTPEQAQWYRKTKPDEELFDTQNDPHELKNLATDPAHKDKLEELRNETLSWIERVDDKNMKPELELIEDFWPGQVQPKTSRPVLEEDAGLVSLKCDTPGASIGYKIFAKEEPVSWQVYTKPFSIEKGETLVCSAHRIGYLPSELVKKEN